MRTDVDHMSALRRHNARQRKLRYIARTAAAGDKVITKGLALRESQARRLEALAVAAGLPQAHFVIERLGLDGKLPVCSCGRGTSAPEPADMSTASLADLPHLPAQFQKMLAGCLKVATAKRLDKAFEERPRGVSPVAFLSSIIEAGVEAAAYLKLDNAGSDSNVGVVSSAATGTARSEDGRIQKAQGRLL